MERDRLLYETAVQLSDAAGLVSRCSKPCSLDDAMRKHLFETAAVLHEFGLAQRGAGGAWRLHGVALVIQEQMGALCNQADLIEWIGRAETALAMLAQTEPHPGNLVWHRAHLAWLEEFLLDCCHHLLRAVVTQRHAPR
jgi:hypothetical protein